MIKTAEFLFLVVSKTIILNSLCPLKPLTDVEMKFLEDDIAQQIMGFDTIPCNNCKYCIN